MVLFSFWCSQASDIVFFGEGCGHNWSASGAGSVSHVVSGIGVISILVDPPLSRGKLQAWGWGDLPHPPGNDWYQNKRSVTRAIDGVQSSVLEMTRVQGRRRVPLSR